MSERSSAIDPLRVLLAAFVVGIHTNFPMSLEAEAKQVLVNGLYRAAVPIFAVISGFFFLGAVQSGRAGAYLRRILVLYLVWTAIYAPIYGPDLGSAANALRMLIFGYFHLWYLAALLFAAALLLGLIRAGLPLRWIVTFAALMAGTGLLLQYLALSGQVRMMLDVYRNGLFTIFPYVTMGYVLALNKDHLPRGPWVGVATVIALIAVMGESLIWMRIANGMSGIDAMIALLVFAPLVFLLARSAPGFGDGKWLAGLSAFTYFFHIHVTDFVGRRGIDGDARFLTAIAVCLAIFALLGLTAPTRRLRAFLT